MKIHKIMTDLLKLVDKKKTAPVNYGFDDQFLYLTLDGHRLFKIYNGIFFIDLRKALPEKAPLTDPAKLFKIDGYEDAVKTSELRVVQKNTVVKIANEKNHAWINVNYLKEFNEDCTFKVLNEKSGVMIYEDGRVVGVVLPIYIKEDNKE